MKINFSDIHTGSYKPLQDPSLLAIIFGNVLSICLAYAFKWPMEDVMWVYWGQSVIIGIINAYRMWNLTDFTTKGMTVNDKPVPETESGKRQTVFFFCIHYGGFHFVYFIFLWTESPLTDLSQTDLMWLLLAVFGFLGSHSYSLRYNANRDFKDKKPNLGTIMFYPYLRIIPMHLIIIFGGLLGGGMIFVFMVMKTFADAAMHAVEHNIFQKPEKDGVI